MFDINEGQSSIDIYFKLQLQWFNESLQFQFLKDDENLNTVAQDQYRIWTPRLVFRIIKKELKHENHKIFITKRGSPFLARDGVTELYTGDENPINLLLQERIL